MLKLVISVFNVTLCYQLDNSAGNLETGKKLYVSENSGKMNTLICDIIRNKLSLKQM